MKFNIRPHGINYKEKILFTVNIKNPDFQKYYKEITSRFLHMSDLDTAELQDEYMKENYLCDIDEVSLGDMSINTLQDFIKFINK